MRPRLAAVAVLLSIALVAVPTAAADGPSFESQEPCILTGLGCFVLLVVEAVVASAMECVEELHCL